MAPHPFRQGRKGSLVKVSNWLALASLCALLVAWTGPWRRGNEEQKGSVDVHTMRAKHPAHLSGVQGGDRLVNLGLHLIGGIYLVSAGVHVGIVGADAQQYRGFADGALPSVRIAWRDVFMANPSVWGLVVAAGELAIGTAILAGGRWTRVGLVGAIGFHGALMLFGFGFWAWSLPMLVLLVLLVALWRRCETAKTYAATELKTPARPRSERGAS